MIYRNAVIQWKDELWRVLEVSNVRAQAALISLDSTSFKLEVVRMEELARDSKDAEDPFANRKNYFTSDLLRERAENDYAKIASIVEDRSLLFDDRKMQAAISLLSAKDRSQRKALQRKLMRYWRRGQTIFALQFGPQVPVKRSFTTARPGPKGKLAQSPARTEAVQKIFERVCKAYLLKYPPLSIPKAHVYVLDQWIKDGGTMENAPTQRQLGYFYKTHYSAEERARAKVGPISFEKDIRSLRGTTYDAASRIGEIYEIDSTVADVTLVRENDRNKIVGRPTLYVVTDVYSGMIVGVHATFENSQFISAADALYAAISPKVAFAKRFGLEIGENAWPVAGLPETIVADNAELCSERRLEAMAKGLGIFPKFTPSYRGDVKGTVEKTIHLLQKQIEPFLTGKPLKSTVKKAGGGDTRTQATATLSDYMRFVIEAVLHLNRRVRQNRPPEFPTEAAPRPIEIWNWAERTGRNGLQPVTDYARVRHALLVHQDASVSRRGILVNGLRYGSDQTAAAGWFLRQRGDRPREVDVAFDPADLSRIWVVPDKTHPNEWFECELLGDSRRFAGLSLYEVTQIRTEEKAVDEKAKLQHAVEETHFNATQNARAKAIAAAAKHADCGDADAQRRKEIQENRQQERIAGQEARLPEKSAAASPPAPHEDADDGPRMPETLAEMLDL